MNILFNLFLTNNICIYFLFLSIHLLFLYVFWCRAYCKWLYLMWVLCLVSSTVLGIIFQICCFVSFYIVLVNINILTLSGTMSYLGQWEHLIATLFLSTSLCEEIQWENTLKCPNPLTNFPVQKLWNNPTVCEINSIHQ